MADYIGSDLFIIGIVDPALQVLWDAMHPLRWYRQLILSRRARTKLSVAAGTSRDSLPPTQNVCHTHQQIRNETGGTH